MLLSLPMRIRWAGWVANTLDLQRSGWRLSARQGIAAEYGEFQLALNHPDYRVYGLTEPIRFDYFAAHASTESMHRIISGMTLSAQLGSDLTLHVMQKAPDSFSPIDAYPQTIERQSIKDFEIFAPAQLVRTKEIIVEPKDVPSLMKKILALQSPKQAEIRDRVRKSVTIDKLREQGLDLRPRQTFHAQILTLDL